MRMFLLIIAFCGVGILGFSYQSMADRYPNTHFAKVEYSARKARSGDFDSVSKLIETIIPTDIVPEEIRRPVVRRLTGAEFNFRRNRQKGISNSDLARTINDFVVRAGAPEFARTSQAQIAALRVKEFPTVPSLITIPTESKRETEMSPAEAAYVGFRMLELKGMDSEFQNSPREWAQLNRQKVEAARNKHIAPRTSARPRWKIRKESEREKKMQQFWQEQLPRIEPVALLQMAESALDALGIAR